VDLTNNLSKRAENLIAESRKIAEKLGNDFVGLEHFFLAYNKWSDTTQFDFNVPISDKKTLIKQVKGVKIGETEDDNFHITKDYEAALINSRFHKWIFSDKQIDPRHIYLAAFANYPANKNEYLKILLENKFKITRIKKLIINILFNSWLRNTGIIKAVIVFL
jgi:hypothetical protein